MGKCGQDAVIKKYNWNTESQKLLDVYQSLVKQRVG